MRRALYIALIIAGVALLGVVGLLLLVDQDNISERFDNYSALERSESWQKGWVPTLIPKTATNIYAGHNIDTNRLYGEFSAQPFSLERDVVGLHKLTDQEKAQLVDSMGWGGLRNRVKKHPVFRWCDPVEKMTVYLYVEEGGRVTYWSSGARSC